MPPRIDNAPGITWRPRKNGWEARWQARSDLVRRGYRPMSAQIWKGIEPDETEKAYISNQCTIHQDDMLRWSRGGLPEIGQFDGTISSLIRCYQTDTDSPYRKGRYSTRIYYDVLCSCVERDIGKKTVEEVTARDLLRWHEQYTAQGKIAMGHSVVGMLRSLATFGATLLASKECRELKVLMHDMRFTMPKARNERLTAEMATAIRKEAHKIGKPSIALAQALQFELMLRQKDVIGEWVPLNEPGLSAVHSGNSKWLRGLDWKEVNENFILTHVTSKRQKEITVDLKLAPMVEAEMHFGSRSALPATGPIVCCERTGLPWTAQDFRKHWRRCADGAGVPKNIRNMDSRAGAISEATDAGAELEHVRQAATHSDISMTQRYSRNEIEKTAGVMKTRMEFRSKKNGNNK